MIKFLKKYHKWIGIIITLFMLLFAVSGIVLNHRGLFSSYEVSRSILPDDYHYQNWNLSAVKKVELIGTDSCLMYGNIGVWLCDTSLTHFIDFNKGLPKGIDNRKIAKIYRSSKGDLFAGTLFGLYQYRFSEQQWQKVVLNLEHPRIVDITEKDDTLLVLTRSFLLISTDNTHFKKHQLLASPEDDKQVSLFKTLWMMHSGEIFGMVGKLVVDGIALIFIFLSLTGLVLFINPYVIKRRKKKHKSIEKIKKQNKWNLDWHNKIGWTTLVLLLITTITGMFLRPPLLIAIASFKVDKMPLTILDNDNPWFDKLRVISYSEATQNYIVGTNEGIYYTPDILNKPLHPYPYKIPFSVMGITVLEPKSPHQYLVGSFEGLFLWDIEKGKIQDYIEQKPYVYKKVKGAPIGKHLVSGYVSSFMGQECFFDYRKGLCSKTGESINHPMPKQLQSQPMSLWNLMLEIHTARIFNSILGMFYILIIPLVGLLTIFVLISGFVVWYKRHRKKRLF